MGTKGTVRTMADSTPTVVRNLAKWLRECLYLVTDEEGAARFGRIVCRQLVRGNKRGEEVFFTDVPKKAKDEWTETAAVELYGRLQAEAATLGGLQKYALYAYSIGDNENHTGRFVLRIQGSTDEDSEDGLDSEGPDRTGLTSQAMRHAEALMKINTGGQMTLLSTYQALVGNLTNMVEKLLESQASNIDAVQELLQRREEREVNLIQAKAKAQGISDVVGKLGLLLPAVANKMAGKQIFPVEADATAMMTKALVTSLAGDEERMGKLMGILTPEQSVVFFNLLEHVSSNNGNGNGEGKKE